MIPVPVIHRRIATNFKEEVASVDVSPEAAEVDVKLAAVGLRLIVKQVPMTVPPLVEGQAPYSAEEIARAAITPANIEVSLAHTKGTYAKLAGTNSAGPEGAVALVHKILLEYDPAAFEQWLTAQP